MNIILNTPPEQLMFNVIAPWSEGRCKILYVNTFLGFGGRTYKRLLLI